MKYLRIYNVSIHIYQNRFINESVRKNFLKFSERRKDGVFFESCRRTYVLNNTGILAKFILGYQFIDQV